MVERNLIADWYPGGPLTFTTAKLDAARDILIYGCFAWKAGIKGSPH